VPKLPAATQLLTNLAVQANPADPIRITVIGTHNYKRCSDVHFLPDASVCMLKLA
jgi:hypothetical protein